MDDAIEVAVETQDSVEVVPIDESHARRIRETESLIVVSFEHRYRIGEDGSGNVQQVKHSGILVATLEPVTKLGGSGV